MIGTMPCSIVVMPSFGVLLPPIASIAAAPADMPAKPSHSQN